MTNLRNGRPCDCPCHQEGVSIMHFMACCEPGYVEPKVRTPCPTCGKRMLQVAGPDELSEVLTVCDCFECRRRMLIFHGGTSEPARIWQDELEKDFTETRQILGEEDFEEKVQDYRRWKASR